MNSAAQMGAPMTCLAGRNIPAMMSKSALESSEGNVDFAQNRLHPRKIGATVNLRTNLAGRHALGVADFAREAPRRPPTDKMACTTPPCTVKTFGQLTLPGMAFSRSSVQKCWLAAPHTFQACRAVMMKNLICPDRANARSIARHLHVN